MKKLLLLLVAVPLLLAAAHHVVAAPVANSNLGREYLIGSDSLENWSAGLFTRMGERVISRRGAEVDLEFTKGMAYVGYDVLRWITPYVALGIGDAEIADVDSDGSESELAFGVHFNILDQEIMDPTLVEDRLRINANIYLGMTEATVDGSTLQWEELAANLTVSIVNDLGGNRSYLPYSIAIYAGPAYSDYRSDDFDMEEAFGFVGGLEIFHTKRISSDVSMEKFESEAFTASINIRF